MDDYVPSNWKQISRKTVIRRIQKRFPHMTEKAVNRILDEWSDGVFYGFEMEDWELFFMEEMFK